MKEGDTCVYRIRKSLYKLKQTSHNWYNKFTSALYHIGFKHSKVDHSLFTYKKDNVYVAVLIYVDDIILLENNDNYIAEIKSFLHLF